MMVQAALSQNLEGCLSVGRTLASIVVIAIMLASVLVVPSASSDSTFETYVVATIGSPDTLDPAVDYDTAGQEVIQNVYETLVWYDGSQHHRADTDAGHGGAEPSRTGG